MTRWNDMMHAQQVGITCTLQSWDWLQCQSNMNHKHTVKGACKRWSWNEQQTASEAGQLVSTVQPVEVSGVFSFSSFGEAMLWCWMSCRQIQRLRLNCGFRSFVWSGLVLWLFLPTLAHVISTTFILLVTICFTWRARHRFHLCYVTFALKHTTVRRILPAKHSLPIFLISRYWDCLQGSRHSQRELFRAALVDTETVGRCWDCLQGSRQTPKGNCSELGGSFRLASD